jgi:hypothetical protein
MNNLIVPDKNTIEQRRGGEKLKMTRDLIICTCLFSIIV